MQRNTMSKTGIFRNKIRDSGAEVKPPQFSAIKNQGLQTLLHLTALNASG